jgi:hypothetical protein
MKEQSIDNDVLLVDVMKLTTVTALLIASFFKYGFENTASAPAEILHAHTVLRAGVAQAV